ncbi:MAG: carbonic anhydrase family protein [Chloroflexales bacterium]|nr:carbonic anhydrase family protein [Chloroflexales bacterium]
MCKQMLSFLALAALMMVIVTQPIGAATNPGKPSWNYAQHGADWGQLQDADGSFPYATCDTGQQQSPIDINQVSRTDLGEINVAYQPTSLRIMNNSHTIRVGYEQARPASTISIEDTTYTLQQFHFHARSEHTRGAGNYTPVELHLVHKSAGDELTDGQLAVIGVQIEQGSSPNPTFQPILDNLPVNETEDAQGNYVYLSYPSETVNTLDLLPTPRTTSAGDHRPYYTYSGSLTTPACDEGVMWFVVKDYNYMSQSQITTLTAVAAMQKNYRSTQPLGDRTVKLYEVN